MSIRLAQQWLVSDVPLERYASCSERFNLTSAHHISKVVVILIHIHTLQKANTNHTGCVSDGGDGDGDGGDGDGGDGDGDGSGLDKVAIAGIICGVIGGVLVILVVVGGLVYYYKRRNNQSKGYTPINVNP